MFVVWFVDASGKEIYLNRNPQLFTGCCNSPTSTARAVAALLYCAGTATEKFSKKVKKEMSRVEGRGRAKKENENFKGG
jgi:hypothetical protein